MPIYEYLCPVCNRIYSFLAKSPGGTLAPTCPTCGGADMRRKMSRFAVVGSTRKAAAREPGGADAAGGADGEALDDPRVEREMTRLMQDAEGIDENDPRQLGALMRRMSAVTGEALDPDMEAAVRRLEAGEDPEKIEADMGDVLGDDGDAAPDRGAPSVDDGLYPL